MPSTTRTFKITIDATGKTLDVHITEPTDVQAENLSLTTWCSSNILAGALHTLDLPASIQADDSNNGSSQPLPILEIGAGTALVGLTAAALCKADAVLTDLPSIVPSLDGNIAVNRATFAACGARVRAGSLDWRTPEQVECSDGTTMLASSKARVIFAADTIYDEAHPELLERTVVQWLERSGKAKFVICYSLRVAYLDYIRDMWERLERVGLKATSEGRATGEATNGDDEMLCEWAVWQWSDLCQN